MSNHRVNHKYTFNGDRFRIQLARWIGDKRLDEAADLASTDKSTLSRILNGGQPDLETFVNLMKAMGMPSLNQFISRGGHDVGSDR